MELTYHWKGDYLIPDILLGDGSSYNISKYGRMRQKYLCENYPSEYLHLVDSSFSIPGISYRN